MLLEERMSPDVIKPWVIRRHWTKAFKGKLTIAVRATKIRKIRRVRLIKLSVYVRWANPRTRFKRLSNVVKVMQTGVASAHGKLPVSVLVIFNPILAERKKERQVERPMVGGGSALMHPLLGGILEE